MDDIKLVVDLRELSSNLNKLIEAWPKNRDRNKLIAAICKINEVAYK